MARWLWTDQRHNRQSFYASARAAASPQRHPGHTASGSPDIVSRRENLSHSPPVHRPYDSAPPTAHRAGRAAPESAVTIRSLCHGIRRFSCCGRKPPKILYVVAKHDSHPGNFLPFILRDIGRRHKVIFISRRTMIDGRISPR